MFVISFDAATKSLAYTLIEIDLKYFDNNNDIIQYAYKLNKMYNILFKKYNNSEEKYKLLNEIELLSAEIEKILKIISDMIIIHHGETINLCPEILDKDITTIQRVQLTTEYCKKCIKQIKELQINELVVMVELQMGPNLKSKISSVILFTIFALLDIKVELIEVNSCLKNKIYFGELNKYEHFSCKYDKSYTANKNHATENFITACEFFKAPLYFKSIKRVDLGHMADSFMQILGYYTHINK